VTCRCVRRRFAGSCARRAPGCTLSAPPAAQVTEPRPAATDRRPGRVRAQRGAPGGDAAVAGLARAPRAQHRGRPVRWPGGRACGAAARPRWPAAARGRSAWWLCRQRGPCGQLDRRGRACRCAPGRRAPACTRGAKGAVFRRGWARARGAGACCGAWQGERGRRRGGSRRRGDGSRRRAPAGHAPPLCGVLARLGLSLPCVPLVTCLHERRGPERVARVGWQAVLARRCTPSPRSPCTCF